MRIIDAKVMLGCLYTRVRCEALECGAMSYREDTRRKRRVLEVADKDR